MSITAGAVLRKKTLVTSTSNSQLGTDPIARKLLLGTLANYGRPVLGHRQEGAKWHPLPLHLFPCKPMPSLLLSTHLTLLDQAFLCSGERDALPEVLLVNNAGPNYGLDLGACEPHSECTAVKDHLESMVSPSQRTEVQGWSELIGISNTDSGMIVE